MRTPLLNSPRWMAIYNVLADELNSQDEACRVAWLIYDAIAGKRA